MLTQAKLQARVTPQAAALLSAHGTVASSIIQDRVIYASAMTDGRTAVDVEPKGAAAEFTNQDKNALHGRLLSSIDPKQNFLRHALGRVGAPAFLDLNADRT